MFAVSKPTSDKSFASIPSSKERVKWIRPRSLSQSDISDELAELVKPELVPGERLFWVAKSQPGRWNRWATVTIFVPWIIGSLLVGIASLAAFNGEFRLTSA